MSKINMNSVKSTAIYTKELHHAILTGKLPADLKNKGGVYLLVLRTLKNNSNSIVYSYIYYPDLFTDSLLAYLITKTNFEESFLFKEWGDFYTVIDNRLGNNKYVDNLKKKRDEVNNYFIEFLNSPRFTQVVNSYEFNPYINTVSAIFYILKKTTTVLDVDSIITLIDLAIKKDYIKFLLIPFKASGTKKEAELKQLTIKEDLYILKDCIFVVKSKEELLKKLNSMKTTINGTEVTYTVNKVAKNSRYQLNGMTSFLCCLDQGYRDNLYKHQLSFVTTNARESTVKLPRSKFSFKHIHLNLSKVKYYSTTSSNNSNCSLDK